MIQFRCPHCDRPIKVKPELAGRKGKCPGCQSVVVIPTASSGPAAPAPPATPTPQPPPRKPKPQPEFDFSSDTGSDFDFSSPASSSSASNTGEASFENFAPNNPYSASASTPSSRTRKNQDTQLPLGLGIGSTALGTISLVCGCCMGLFQIPVALGGLGMGIAGIIYSKGQQGASRVFPIVGTIISSIGVLFSIALLVLMVVVNQNPQEFLDRARNRQQFEEQFQRDQEELFKDFQEQQQQGQLEQNPFGSEDN